MKVKKLLKKSYLTRKVPDLLKIPSYVTRTSDRAKTADRANAFITWLGWK